jgi:RHS repeat-associated protein
MEMLRSYYSPYHASTWLSNLWITDGTGQAIQHLHYLPFGEDWVDQRNFSWNAPYTFSGKEKDAETGYGYFGARYYDSGLSIWISVDPMAHKYPYQTNYVYCSNNPIRIIDPNGEDEYEFTETGQITWKAHSDNDVFYKVDADGNRTGIEMSFEGKIVENEFSVTNNDGVKVNCLEINNINNSEKLFEFLSINTECSMTEWGKGVFIKNGSLKHIIGTNDVHEPGVLFFNAAIFDNDYEFIRADHNHPDGDNGVSPPDIDNAQRINAKYPNAVFYNYTVSNGYTPYNGNSTPSHPEIKFNPISPKLKIPKTKYNDFFKSN